MRKSLILTLLIVVSTPLFSANDYNSLHVLRDSPDINVSINFDNAVLYGISKPQLDSIVAANTDIILDTLTAGMNIKPVFLRYGSFPSARFSMLLHILSIDEDGAMKAMVTIIDMNSMSEIASFKVRTRGGFFGNFTGLLFSALYRLGENTTEHINSKLN